MKKIIIGTTMAMGILSVGAISAFATDFCDKCADQQAVRQFTSESAALTATLKAKDAKLRELYSYDSIDIREVSALEADIKGLKDKINTTATKYGIQPCSRS